MEHVLYTHLISYLDECQFLFPNQHRLKKKKITVPPASYSSSITDLHFKNHSLVQTNIIFIYFTKTFLIPLCTTICSPNSMFSRWTDYSWDVQFLTKGQQSISINNSFSTSLPVTSGVSQNGVLVSYFFKSILRIIYHSTICRRPCNLQKNYWTDRSLHTSK